MESYAVQIKKKSKMICNHRTLIKNEHENIHIFFEKSILRIYMENAEKDF